MFTKLVELMDSFLEMGVPGYDCIVYHKGKCVFRHMNGYTDVENKIPVKGNEIYNIYSCSKPITCAAALKLYEEGKIGLDDKLKKYLPEFENMYVKSEGGVRLAKNEITIKHLFTMTAGFTYELKSPELMKMREETGGKCTTREAMKYLAKEPLSFEPGEKWQYSLCHDVLAAVVEVASGMNFEDYVKKNIFDVLGMSNSSFLLPLDEMDKICEHYTFDTEKNIAVKRSKIPDYRLDLDRYASGGAGCVSTVEDYIKFLEAMRVGDIILKKETIDLMSTNCITKEQSEGYWVEGYGYGLGVRCPNKENANTDFGWGGAAGAYLAIDRDADITLFYVQHLLSSPNHSIRSRVMPVAKECILGK